MSDPAASQDLIRRLQAGDEQAMADLHREYRPMICRIATNGSPSVDSERICESVLKDFCHRVQHGSDDVDAPEDLERLLAIMTERATFQDQLRRLRACDKQAEAEVYDGYKRMILRIVDNRTRIRGLRNKIGAESVCQSVLKSFILRARRGSYELEGPEDLKRLLSKIATNKLTNIFKRERTSGRHPGEGKVVMGLPDGSESGERNVDGTKRSVWNPLKDLVDREQVDAIKKALREKTPEERRIYELRVDEGWSWREIAEELGKTQEACRNKHKRVIGSLRAMGLNEVDDG